MTITRQDAWTIQDDQILAETVLKHIQTGSTQLAAFAEVAEVLQRTSAACGFRWNAEVRKRYEAEIKEAKLARRASAPSGKGARTNGTRQPNAELFVTVSQHNEQPGGISDYTDQIIALAQNQKLQLSNMAKQIRWLNDQLNEKENEIARLKNELEAMRAQPSEWTVTEDYKTLLSILQRARQLGVLGEEEKEKPAFRVDANGNIEMIG